MTAEVSDNWVTVAGLPLQRRTVQGQGKSGEAMYQMLLEVLIEPST